MHEIHPARLLAGCSVCIIEHCADCDVVHVHVGAASMRFRPAAFVQLCETLLSALGQVTPDAIRAAWPMAADLKPSH
ncbi:MAG: hypothetical protein AAB294_07245 [Pseudomonadota bacterium]